MADDPTKPKGHDEAHPSGANLRHDLRTPINQIIGYSEMLEEDADSKLSPDLKRITTAARRMLELVDRIPDELGGPRATPAPRLPPRRPAPPARHSQAPPAPTAPPAAAPPPTGRRPRPAAAVFPPLEEEDAPGFGTMAIRSAVSKAVPGTGALLVVDDNELNRDMLSRRLKSRGYAVVTAEDGPKCLDLVRSQPFDLILLDIMMPGISGIDVLKILRARYSVAELPIIMATAKDQGTDVVEALTLGANDYVTKPLDFPVVLARVENQLSLKRAMEEINRLANELEKRNRFIKHTFGRYLSEEVVDKPPGDAGGAAPRRREARGHAAHVRPARLHVHGRPLHPGAGGARPQQLPGHDGGPHRRPPGHHRRVHRRRHPGHLRRAGDAARRRRPRLRLRHRHAAGHEGGQRLQRQEGLPDVEMGIAVNTGEVIVGNIGSQTRAKYGVVGSHVNLAGRIEGFTVGGQVLVSASTLAQAGPLLEVGQRVTFQAKGFKDPVDVYDLRGVGGTWNVRLPVRDDRLEPLQPELAVTVAVLEGKQMSDLTFNGTLVQGHWAQPPCAPSARCGRSPT